MVIRILVISKYSLTLYAMTCVISPNSGASSSGASRMTIAPFLYSVEFISSLLSLREQSEIIGYLTLITDW